MATDYAGHDATRLPQADDLRMMRATEQQPANGAYTLEQIMSAGETVAAHLPDSRDRADFRKRLNDVYARLQPMPKLKTPETERFP